MKKLKLDSFRIAKLSNPKVIFGGTGQVGDTDGTDTITGDESQITSDSTKYCTDHRPKTKK